MVKILIAGVGKNIETSIPSIKKSFDLFKENDVITDVRLVIYENNSNDNSKLLLQNMADEDPEHVEVLSENFSDEELLQVCKATTLENKPCRMELISNARNRLLEMIENEKYDDFEYVIMMDLDNVYVLPVSKICSILSQKQDFDAMICKGIWRDGGMYDLYSYRDEHFLFGPEIIMDYFWDMNYLNTIKKYVHNRKGCIPVYSAFNGMAILKKESIKGIRYSAIPTKTLDKFYRRFKNKIPNLPEIFHTHVLGVLKAILLFGNDKNAILYNNNTGHNYPVVCEHVPFFLEMRERGFNKIVLNTELVWPWNRIN